MAHIVSERDLGLQVLFRFCRLPLSLKIFLASLLTVCTYDCLGEDECSEARSRHWQNRENHPAMANVIKSSWSEVENKSMLDAVQRDFEVMRDETKTMTRRIRSKKAFWLHESRCTLEPAMELLSPLKKAVRLRDAVTHPRWGPYVQIVVWIACDSTWQNRIQFEDPAQKHLQDQLQIYEYIRAAPEMYCANRPPVSKVPTHFGGVLDEGRLGLRAAAPRADSPMGVQQLSCNEVPPLSCILVGFSLLVSDKHPGEIAIESLFQGF